MPDLIVRERVPHTHPDELTEETLPIVHDCPQVAVTIRAEEMTEFELTYACLALKKTEDRYHATLRTDQDNPVKTWYDKVEILVFGSFESMNAYHLAVRGYDIGRPTYFWPIDEEHHPWILMTLGHRVTAASVTGETLPRVSFSPYSSMSMSITWTPHFTREQAAYI